MAPRLGSGGGRRKRPDLKVVKAGDAGNGGDGRELKPSDNRAKVLAAEEAQLLSFVGQATAQMKKVEAKEAELKIEKDSLDTILNLAKGAGFEKTMVRSLIKDLKVRGTKKNAAEDESKRARYRRWLGLPVGDEEQQRDLLPEEIRDEFDYYGMGLAAALRGDGPKPPTDVPARMQAKFTEGHHDGIAKIAWGMKPDKNPKPNLQVPGPSSGPEVELQRGPDEHHDEAGKLKPPEGEEFTEATEAELAKQAGRKVDHETAPAETI